MPPRAGARDAACGLRMKTIIASLVAVFGATTAAADPAERSQHPRIGLMAEVYFDTDSAELKWGASRELGRVAGWAVANPRGVVVVEGHADSRGADDYNLDLSLQRAYTARRELVQAGVPPRQIVVVGYGEAEPRRDNNRRATIWVTRTGHDAVVAALEARDLGVVHPAEAIDVTQTARAD